MAHDILEIMSRPIDWFSQFGDVTTTCNGPLVFKDNGARILGVAHLDCVQPTKARPPRRNASYVKGPQLDDRLGVWLMLDALPRLGVRFDLLLTDEEERCRSTAAHFDPPREYNWIFSFDRRGTDFVMYDYETPENAQLMMNCGMKLGQGTISDISFLDHLGVAGYNIGCGYHLEHTKDCYVCLYDTMRQVEKFKVFYERHKDTRLPWTPPPTKTWWFPSTKYKSEVSHWTPAPAMRLSDYPCEGCHDDCFRCPHDADYRTNQSRLVCTECGHEWDMDGDNPFFEECPRCQSVGAYV
jgi:hypothetical protein